jgi:hypothetical protein
MKTNIEIYADMCKYHDFSHAYSDDRFVYRRGSDDKIKIDEFAEKNLGVRVANAIWNDAVLEHFDYNQIRWMKGGEDR